jgi:glutaredoxin
MRPPHRLLPVLLLALGSLQCGSDTPPPAPTPVAPPPASFEVVPGADGVVFRFRDPATGEVRSATSLAEIPPAARAAVTVYDPAHPAPAGADFVADLSREPPHAARAVPGFAFAPPPRLPEVRKQGTREVVLFATSWCGYCSKARKFFQSRGVPYTELDLEKDPGAERRLEELARAAGIARESLQGVPIIFVGVKVVAGWDEAEVRRLLDG